MLADESNAAHCLAMLKRWPEWCVDTETTGLHPEVKDVMVGIAVQGVNGYDTSDPVYFPFRHREANVPMSILPPLLRALAKRRRTWWWNAPFDLRVLWNEGLTHDLDNVRDVMLDTHLCDENQDDYSLKGNAVRYIDPRAGDAERELQFLLDQALLPGKGEMWRLHPKSVAGYACDDVVYTYKMAERNNPIIEQEQLGSVAAGVGRYAMVSAEMVRRGFRVDRGFLHQAIAEARAEMSRITIEACNMAGRSINLSSPKKVGMWLGVESTEAEVLEQLDDPRAKLVIESRAYQKAISSYYRPFLLRSSEDETLHCDMRLHGTISGRAAVRQPPLQSLPRDTGVYKVKESIIARPGYVLLRADYSQAEIRMACHYGKEQAMAAIVRSGRNQHRVVSDDLGVPYDAAKRINFSVIYGIGAQTLSENLHIPESQAKRYLDLYHGAYPGFRRLYYQAQNFAERNHYITLWTGRRRHYNRGEYTPEHKASSNLIQGGVAELMRTAQTKLRDELRSEGVRQIMQVHDDAVMEVPEDRVQELAPEIKRLMESDAFDLPMVVDIKWGRNMAEKRGEL